MNCNGLLLPSVDLLQQSFEGILRVGSRSRISSLPEMLAPQKYGHGCSAVVPLAEQHHLIATERNISFQQTVFIRLLGSWDASKECIKCTERDTESRCAFSARRFESGEATQERDCSALILNRTGSSASSGPDPAGSFLPGLCWKLATSLFRADGSALGLEGR